MSTYIQRMQVELTELSGRLNSLDAYIEHNAQFALLEDEDQLLMKTQSVHMTWYHNVLEERISNAKQK